MVQEERVKASSSDLSKILDPTKKARTMSPPRKGLQVTSEKPSKTTKSWSQIIQEPRRFWWVTSRATDNEVPKLEQRFIQVISFTGAEVD